MFEFGGDLGDGICSGGALFAGGGVWVVDGEFGSVIVTVPSFCSFSGTSVQ